MYAEGMTCAGSWVKRKIFLGLERRFNKDLLFKERLKLKNVNRYK